MPEWVKRDAIRKEEILSAVVKSGRPYEKIMNFLNAGSDGEKAEKNWKFTYIQMMYVADHNSCPEGRSQGRN